MIHDDPLIQFFGYTHLPPDLQEVSEHFHALAMTIVRLLPRNAERTVALRKLLEAKDCAVRARVWRDPADPKTPDHRPTQVIR